MAFESGSLDQSQRVNLSEQAGLVMESDRVLFCKEDESPNAFLNRVFAEFKDSAHASVAIALARERQRVLDSFARRPEQERTQAADICMQYLKSKIAVVKQHPKGTSVKFRLNQENFHYLTTDSECREDRYYKDPSGKAKISLYLKALFEEYAALPLHRRERIYYAKTCEMIELAIRDGIQLKIKVASGREYYVKPYEIRLDIYHYLTGISMPVTDDDSVEGKSAAFRISAIADIRLVKSRSGYLTEAMKKKLQKDIRQKGVQFLTNELSNIRIKLSKWGVRKYQNQLHLRPSYTEILPGNIYCFNCTERQIEYYFFKFGSDALILEPELLAKRFASMYKKAAEVYQA